MHWFVPRLSGGRAGRHERRRALSWLVNIARPLLSGALVPASEGQTATGRTHALTAPRVRPVRPGVADIRVWMIPRCKSNFRRRSR
jgi:hypothetical protein